MRVLVYHFLSCLRGGNALAKWTFACEDVSLKYFGIFSAFMVWFLFCGVHFLSRTSFFSVSIQPYLSLVILEEMQNRLLDIGQTVANNRGPQELVPAETI